MKRQNWVFSIYSKILHMRMKRRFWKRRFAKCRWKKYYTTLDYYFFSTHSADFNLSFPPHLFNSYHWEIAAVDVKRKWQVWNTIFIVQCIHEIIFRKLFYLHLGDVPSLSSIQTSWLTLDYLTNHQSCTIYQLQCIIA